MGSDSLNSQPARTERKVFGREPLKSRFIEAFGFFVITAFSGGFACLGQLGVVPVDEDGPPGLVIALGYAVALFCAAIAVSIVIWGSEAHFIIGDRKLVVTRGIPGCLSRTGLPWSDIQEVHVAAGELVFKTSRRTVRGPLLVNEAERSVCLAEIRARLPEGCKVNLSGSTDRTNRTYKTNGNDGVKP